MGDLHAQSTWQWRGIDYSELNPLREYCFNSFRWFLNPVNPSTYFGLKISARVAPSSPLFGYYIDLPPVYLQIRRNNPLLTLYTYRTTGSPVHEVGMYIDGVRYYSPIFEMEVTEGSHTITVDQEYYRPGYKYTFQYWNDDLGYWPSRTRTVDISDDTFLKPYYLETYIGGGGGPRPR